MKRGDIYFAELNPTVGAEIKKTRPVLIVSNDINNLYSDTITVIPLSSKIDKIFPFEVYLKKSDSKLEKDGKAKCHQIRTISKKRLISNRAGFVSKDIMVFIDSALKLHLSLK